MCLCFLWLSAKQLYFRQARNRSCFVRERDGEDVEAFFSRDDTALASKGSGRSIFALTYGLRKILLRFKSVIGALITFVLCNVSKTRK